MEKLKTTELMALILLIAGIVLIFVALFIPPLGIIHSSVLWTLGQMFTLIGALMGVNAYYGSRISKLEDKVKP